MNSRERDDIGYRVAAGWRDKYERERNTAETLRAEVEQLTRQRDDIMAAWTHERNELLAIVERLRRELRERE